MQGTCDCTVLPSRLSDLSILLYSLTGPEALILEKFGPHPQVLQ